MPYDSELATEGISPADTRYEMLRREMCWNARTPARFPDAIATASTTEDVQKAVRRARGRGLQVSPRGSGHSWASPVLRDSGLLLDLSRLHHIKVDPSAAVAWVEPGVTGDELASALAAYNLAFPVGHCPGIGLGGYLLGGGIPWNVPAWGPACKSVRAVEVVTADGELVRADPAQNPDLYWAARGGGVGFPGIITRFELQLYPLPSTIRVSQWLYPMELLDEVVRWTGTAAETISPHGQMITYLRVALPSMAHAHDGKYMIMVQGVAFTDSMKEADSILSIFDRAPMRRQGLEITRCRPTTVPRLQAEFGELYPEPRRYAVDHMWLGDEHLDDLLSLAATHLQTVPSEDSHMLFFLVPQSREELPDMAFSCTDRIFFSPNAIWEDPRHDAVNTRWTRDVVEAFEPYATGYYINETDLFRSPERSTKAFAPDNWRKLQLIIEQYDPDKVFAGFPETLP